MDFLKLKEKLKNAVAEENIQLDKSMAKECSFKCGGNAACYIVCDSVDELLVVLKTVKEEKADYFILGNGSNVIFTDGGFDGVVIKLRKEFKEIVREGNSLIAGAAAMMPYLSKLAAAYSLSGLEFCCGIPGSLGGGIFMNAGAYGSSLDRVLETVTAVNEDGEITQYNADELELSYRHSRFMKSNEIIIQAKIRLATGNENEIRAKMAENTKARKEKQPVNYPSAGSFFKRPENAFAGALIENAGLKGYRVGGAEVSALHAGFLINADKASASDVLELCRYVQDTVYKKDGILLEPEVRIIGK